MRILIIGPGKLKYMPYANFYLDHLDRVVNEIHVAYWNRDEKDEDLSNFNGLHLHEFKKFMLNDATLMTKLRRYYSFRRFCLSLIRKYDFDYIIVLHSIPAVVLYDLLTKRFAERYIFDYRDSTYESYVAFFRKAIAKLIRMSKVTFTSSDGFREYFPKDSQDKVITSHNLLEDSLGYRNYIKKEADKIRIAFWGFIRHVEINKCLIDRIGTDVRFELHYYGRLQSEALILKKYVFECGYSNVFFHGEYIPEDRYEFVKNTDIIHNLYLDSNMLRAMANKYYDGLIFRIPQICFPDSQMAEMCKLYGVGISLDPRNLDFCNRLYNYYISIDRTLFNANCDKELNRVVDEYNKGVEVVHDRFGL